LVGGIFAGYGYRTMPQMIVDEEARFSVGTDDAMSAEPLVADETNFSLPKMIFEVASSGCSCRKTSFKRRAENGGFVPKPVVQMPPLAMSEQLLSVPASHTLLGDEWVEMQKNGIRSYVKSGSSPLRAPESGSNCAGAFLLPRHAVLPLNLERTGPQMLLSRHRHGNSRAAPPARWRWTQG
jgi:hypothetical protein